MCVPRKRLPSAWLQPRTSLSVPYTDCLQVLAQAGICYRSRDQVEQDPRYKQLIPYVVAVDKVGLRVGCYRRKGSETRLHGRESLGVGGHVNLSDARSAQDGLDLVLTNGIHRELSEEFQNLPEPYQLTFRGIINEEESQVGEVHLGLVFRMDVSAPERLRPGAELYQFRWLSRAQAAQRPLELWSRLALEIV